jgi:hypothetical protein
LKADSQGSDEEENGEENIRADGRDEIAINTWPAYTCLDHGNANKVPLRLAWRFNKSEKVILSLQWIKGK